MNNLPSLAPRTFEEARAFAVTLSKSNFCPKDYKDKPDDILIAAQMGSEVGLGFMQSVQNIAVINSRPSIWGDAMLALVQASGLMVYHREYFDQNETAICEVARRGDVGPDGKQVIHVVQFSNKDRDTAGLTGKGVHGSYPRRMKQMRARGFALRDKFADVLKGLIAREEAIDITPIDDVHVEQHPMGELSEDETPRAADDMGTMAISSDSEAAKSGRVMVLKDKAQFTMDIVSGEIEETPRAAEIKATISPEEESILTEAAMKAVELVLDKQVVEVEEDGVDLPDPLPDDPCTDAEKESFKAYVASCAGTREEKMAALRTVPGWTIVKNMTKRQMEAAMKKLGEMK